MESNFSLELNLGFLPNNPALALYPVTLKEVLLGIRIAKLFHLLHIEGGYLLRTWQKATRLAQKLLTVLSEALPPTIRLKSRRFQRRER